MPPPLLLRDFYLKNRLFADLLQNPLQKLTAASRRPATPALRRRRQAFYDIWCGSRMKTLPGRLVGAQVLQHIVDGIFKARAGFMGGSYAFGDQLADFKAVDSLRECAVNLVRAHYELQRPRWLLRKGAELVRSGSTAGAEQAG